MADEVVPFVEKHYRSLTLPSARLVAGPSYAGLASAYTALRHPDVFGLAYSQSGYLSFGSNALVKAYRQAPRKSIRLYVDIGPVRTNGRLGVASGRCYKFFLEPTVNSRKC